MQLTDQKAKEIAQDFLNRANPTNWSGEGSQPKELETKIISYDIGSDANDIQYTLDISIEQTEEGWEHYCELREKSSGELCVPLHGYGIDSVQNLTDTIMEIAQNI